MTSGCSPLRPRLTPLAAFGLLLLAGLMLAPASLADVQLNNMFGSHMVLQQGIHNRVWGRA